MASSDGGMVFRPDGLSSVASNAAAHHCSLCQGLLGFYERGWLLRAGQAPVRPRCALVRLCLSGRNGPSLHHSYESLPGSTLVRRNDPDFLSLGFGELHHRLWAVPQGETTRRFATVLTTCLSTNQPRWRQIMRWPCYVASSRCDCGKWGRGLRRRVYILGLRGLHVSDWLRSPAGHFMASRCLSATLSLRNCGESQCMPSGWQASFC